MLVVCDIRKFTYLCQYTSSEYIMHNLLSGKRGVIFGALDEKSIAWHVASRCQAEGARFVLTNASVALRLGKVQELAASCRAELIPADATNISELQQLFQRAVEVLGGKIDFILHSIGMSPNVRKSRSYGNLNYDWFIKTLDISALSLHKILQTLEQGDHISEWGSVVALSYVAAQRSFPGYSDMAEAKAVLESIARSYGHRLGQQKKVRINTISQSPTKTTAGTGIAGFDRFYTYAEEMSPLGNATAEECANYCVFLFSDLSRKITMQNLMHDGGFSSTGISEKVVDKL